MENYPSNSHKSRLAAENDIQKPEEKRVAGKVINGNVRTEKKSWLKKILGVMTQSEAQAAIEEALRSPSNSVTVKLPDGSYEFCPAQEGVTLNGEAGRKRNRSASSYMGSYRGGYLSREEPDSRRSEFRDPYEIEDIILDSYGDCELVLDEMNATIERYGLVSVSDLYDMLGKSGGTHADCKYGWNSLRTARIVPVRNGFALRLPRIIPLN